MFVYKPQASTLQHEIFTQRFFFLHKGFFWLKKARYPVKIYTITASLFNLHGSMRVKVAVCSSEMTVSNVLLSTSRTEKCSTVWWTDLAAFCTISAGKSGHSSCSRERYSKVVSKSERQQPHTEIGQCFNPTSGLNSVCLTVALKSHLHSCRAVCSISRKS